PWRADCTGARAGTSTAPARRTSSSAFASPRCGTGSRSRSGTVLGREVDDHMRDREREARLRLADQILLEPVRPARRMRGDDDLVGAERAQRIRDRDERVVVADLAANLEPGCLEPGHRRPEAVLGLGARAVD